MLLAPSLEILALLVPTGKFSEDITLRGSSLGSGLGSFLLGSGSCCGGLLGLFLFFSGLFFIFALLLLDTSPGLLLGLTRQSHWSLDGRKSNLGLFLFILESRDNEFFLGCFETGGGRAFGELRTTVIAVTVASTSAIATSAISICTSRTAAPVAVASTVSSEASATAFITVYTKASGTSEATSFAIASAKATLFSLFPLPLGSAISRNVVLETRVLRHGRSVVHTSWRATSIAPTGRSSSHHITTLGVSLGALFLLALTLHLKLGGSCGKARILLHGRRAHVTWRRSRRTVKVGSGGKARIGGFRRSIKISGRATLGTFSTLGIVCLGSRGEAGVLDFRRGTPGGRLGAVGGTSLLTLTIALLLLFSEGGKALVANDGWRTIATGTATSLAIFTTSGAFLLGV